MVFFKKHLKRRDKELILGNLVAWGTIVAALTLAISLVPASAAEVDQSGGSASDSMQTGTRATASDF